MITKISLIIPCYNRVDELEELFPSIFEQDLKKNKFEIIVVDDGSNDNTKSFMKRTIKRSKLDISYFYQENKGPGKARNLALENAKGDFFVFIDSDVILPAHYLSKLFEELNKNNSDAFGGPDKAHESFSPLLKAIDYAMTSFITTGGIRGKKGKKLAKYFPRSFNMGLSRKVFEKIGGFGDLRHGQDIEFSNRIIKSGAKVDYIHDAFVYHKRRTSLKKFFKQVFNWGVARVNLYKLDSNMLELVHLLPAFATLIFISLFILSLNSILFAVVFKILLTCMAIVYLLSSIHAIFKYENIITPFYVPITMSIQIFAYGFGFIYAYIKRVIFNRGEFKGFSKNYYK